MQLQPAEGKAQQITGQYTCRTYKAGYAQEDIAGGIKGHTQRFEQAYHGSGH